MDSVYTRNLKLSLEWLFWLIDYWIYDLSLIFFVWQESKSRSFGCECALDLRGLRCHVFIASVFATKNTAQTLGCDKDSFFVCFLPLHCCDVACLWDASYCHVTHRLNANTGRVQEVILAEENVLIFNADIIMTWKSAQMDFVPQDFCIKHFALHIRKTM